MIGRVFLGRYEVVSALGQGGMARIYLARHRTTNRQVVLKIMHEEIARNEQFRELFRREIDCMKRFQHPYAVALHDASLDPQGTCLVLEYVKGADFQRLLQTQRNGRFEMKRIGRLIGQLCEVLHAAHLQGIIHRDLKPSNLMVVDWDQPLERLKVMDFGLAHLAEAPQAKAQAGGLMQMVLTGTPEYMAPEQAAGRSLDQRTDIYSLGVVLYELLTGKRPFDKPTPTAYALAHINDIAPTFAAAGAHGVVAPALEAVVHSCLAKDPTRRPMTALDLAQRIGRAIGQPILDPRPVTAVASTSAPATIAGAALRDARQTATKAGTSAAVSNAAMRRTMLLPGGTRPSDGTAKRATQLDPTTVSDINELEFKVEAAMLLPETLDKLNRFAQKLGGKVVSLHTDVIRVLLGKDCRVGPTNGGSGFLPILTEMEMQVARKDPKQPGLHVVTLRLSPVGGGSSHVSPAWRACCDSIHKELGASLAAGLFQSKR